MDFILISSLNVCQFLLLRERKQSEYYGPQDEKAISHPPVTQEKQTGLHFMAAKIDPHPLMHVEENLNRAKQSLQYSSTFPLRCLVSFIYWRSAIPNR